ncbi:MAG: tetratricopeptide repeat protein [Gemmatimonadota bacterium]|nr:tetratricopeptide repeat protein [Gemmatimonadota bacterium]
MDPRARSTGYSTREVAEILGLSASRIRSWARSGLLSPDRGPRAGYRFGFRDVVLLRVVRDLQAGRVPARKIRRALARLRAVLPEGRPLSSLRLATDGERVLVRDDEGSWDAESDQRVMELGVGELAERAAPYVAGTVEAKRERGLDADAWYNVAVELETVSLQEAIKAYREALALDPAHASAHINLGRLLHESGDPAAAAGHYRSAIAADPQSAIAAYDLAIALEDVGDVEEAIGLYRRAVRLEPDYAEAHYNLSRLYERVGEDRKAFRHLLRYRRIAGSA